MNQPSCPTLILFILIGLERRRVSMVTCVLYSLTIEDTVPQDQTHASSTNMAEVFLNRLSDRSRLYPIDRVQPSMTLIQVQSWAMSRPRCAHKDGLRSI